MRVFVVYAPEYNCYGEAEHVPHSYWNDKKLAQKMLKAIPKGHYPFILEGGIRDEKWLLKEVKRMAEEEGP